MPRAGVFQAFPFRCHVSEDLAANRLRAHPTIPPSASPASVDSGELWPRVFCAFEGCTWEHDFGNEEHLEDHLRDQHAVDLEPIRQHMLRRDAPDALRSVYCQAIAAKCRKQAPIAGSSLDRTALHSFAEATAGNNVEALICCSCGGIYPYVAEVAEKGEINWYQPLQRSDSTGELLFLGQPLTVIADLLSLELYLSRYNLLDPARVALTAHETFQDWRLKLPDLESGNLLCCPEDGISSPNHRALAYSRAPFYIITCLLPMIPSI